MLALKRIPWQLREQTRTYALMNGSHEKIGQPLVTARRIRNTKRFWRIKIAPMPERSVR